MEKRFTSGLYLTSNLTYAKSLDDGTFGPTNIFDFGSNYGNSDFIRPWSWVSAFSYELPFGHGRAYGSNAGGFENAVIGGWSLSGILNFEAGMYFYPVPVKQCIVKFDDRIEARRIGSGTVSDPNRNQWFNPADFTVPALYTYGDSGRNIIEGPGFGSIDASLAKAFALGERTKLELRWDVFNALNRTNLANPNSAVDTATAGQITGIVDFKRRMQIGAHLNF